jgi:hypothetical protein
MKSLLVLPVVVCAVLIMPQADFIIDSVPVLGIHRADSGPLSRRLHSPHGQPSREQPNMQDVDAK